MLSIVIINAKFAVDFIELNLSSKNNSYIHASCKYLIMIFIITILISSIFSTIFLFIQEQQGGFAPGTQSITHDSLPILSATMYIYSMTYCHQQHAKIIISHSILISRLCWRPSF